jgi:flagellum-specific ATP synthase
VEIDPSPDGGLLAEVVAVSRERLTCMPLGELSGVHAGARVRATGMPLQVPVGEALLGRVLDGLGRPVDGGPPLDASLEFVDLASETPHALARTRVEEPLTSGVRVLDTMVPLGKGQRLGIFAGSGVGKSTLLAQITRGTDADVRVIGLIGERGREVREFLEENLGPEGMARTVVVVATSDEPPLVRLKAAFVATRIAEGFRDQGRDVLLMMDSITRTAMAQREVGLSAGEPPATRGYPPSVFAMMPKLLEKAGTAAVGSITGLYTVLVDGDDHNEPIADTARSILDGHVVLTRKLATAGHFPAIDVLESISRVATAVVPPPQMADAREVRRLMGALRDVKELIEIGAYQAGSDPLVDRARQLGPAIESFLQQPTGELTPAGDSWAWLNRIVRSA